MHCTHRLWLVPVLIVFLLLHSPDAQADVHDNAVPPYEKWIDFDFAGGTLREYIDQIRQHVPDLNVVIMPRAEEVRMPAMTVRNTRVDTLIMLINQVAIADDLRVSVNMVSEIYTIQITQSGRAGGQPRHMFVDGIHTRVFGLTHLIGENAYQKDDVLQGIEAVLEVVESDGDQPTLRFHEATGLLIVRGTVTQIQSIRETINQLQESLEARRAREGHVPLFVHEQIVNEWRARYEEEKRRRSIFDEVPESHD